MGHRAEAIADVAPRLVGADWTLVRCAFFDQNFEEAFVDVVRHGTFAVPGGDTAELFLDADDIADVVFAALTEDRHIGQLYELTGPRLLTFSDVAAELSAAVGHEVQYVPVAPLVAAAMLTVSLRVE